MVWKEIQGRMINEHMDDYFNKEMSITFSLLPYDRR